MSRWIGCLILLLAVGCSSAGPADTGTVEVLTTTSGIDLPPSYCAVVFWENDSLNVHVQQDIGINARALFTDIEARSVRVDLGGRCTGVDTRAGWPQNCVAQPGEMPGLGARQSVSVDEGGRVTATFTVTCTAIP